MSVGPNYPNKVLVKSNSKLNLDLPKDAKGVIKEHFKKEFAKFGEIQNIAYHLGSFTEMGICLLEYEGNNRTSGKCFVAF